MNPDVLNEDQTTGLHDRPTGDATDRSAASPAWFRPGLGAVAAVGLAWRLLYLAVSKVNQSPAINQGDAFWYSTTAQSLARGQLFRNKFTGRPTAEHPPLTPLVITPASWLSHSALAQRLTMVLLGTAVIVLVGMAGRRLAGPVAGLAAAAVSAALPSLWINDVLIMSETVTALVTAGLIWAGITLARRPTTRLAAGAGALCGLSALARAETGLLLPLMVWVVIAVATNLTWRRRLALIGIATVGAVLVMAPWIGLNLTRFEEPVAISTNDGLTLAGANCDATYHGALKGGWLLNPCVANAYATIDADKTGSATPAPGSDRPCFDTFQRRRPCLDPSQVSTKLRAEGIRYISGHLGEVPGVVLARNARVWGAYRLDQSVFTGAGEGRPTWASRLGFITTWIVLPVSIAGLVLLRRRRVSLAPFLAPLAVVVLTASAFTGLTPRIRIPWDVASCLLTGVVIAWAIDRYRTRGERNLPTRPALSERFPSPAELSARDE